jgi:hypothetical protein
MFSVFLAVFCAFGFKIEKSTKMTKKFFAKKVSNNAEFHANFRSVEKVLKKFAKKSLKQKCDKIWTISTFTNVHQTFFAFNFFFMHFFKTFSMDLKSARNSVFFYTF